MFLHEKPDYKRRVTRLKKALYEVVFMTAQRPEVVAGSPGMPATTSESSC